jgi:hypothetical protein
VYLELGLNGTNWRGIFLKILASTQAWTMWTMICLVSLHGNGEVFTTWRA